MKNFVSVFIDLIGNNYFLWLWDRSHTIKNAGAGGGKMYCCWRFTG